MSLLEIPFRNLKKLKWFKCRSIYSKHEGVQYVYPVILKYFFSLDNIPNLLNSH